MDDEKIFPVNDPALKSGAGCKADFRRGPAVIETVQGDLLKADVEALVNTVNCEGVMGKGLALQFKRAFPENFKAYEMACRDGVVRPGKMFIFETGLARNPRYIINFPTKRRWRDKSRMEDIKAGLEALVEDLLRLKVSSVAIPPLGCGLGGLDWAQVRPLIERAMSPLRDVRILLFEPIRSF